MHGSHDAAAPLPPEPANQVENRGGLISFDAIFPQNFGAKPESRVRAEKTTKTNICRKESRRRAHLYRLCSLQLFICDAQRLRRGFENHRACAPMHGSHDAAAQLPPEPAKQGENRGGLILFLARSFFKNFGTEPECRVRAGKSTKTNIFRKRSRRCPHLYRLCSLQLFSCDAQPLAHLCTHLTTLRCHCPRSQQIQTNICRKKRQRLRLYRLCSLQVFIRDSQRLRPGFANHSACAPMQGSHDAAAALPPEPANQRGG